MTAGFGYVPPSIVMNYVNHDRIAIDLENAYIKTAGDVLQGGIYKVYPTRGIYVFDIKTYVGELTPFYDLVDCPTAPRHSSEFSEAYRETFLQTCWEGEFETALNCDAREIT